MTASCPVHKGLLCKTAMVLMRDATPLHADCASSCLSTLLKAKVVHYAGSCHMDMMLYIPQGSPPPHQPPLHPLNALRNRAIAAAQTEVLTSRL